MRGLNDFFLVKEWGFCWGGLKREREREAVLMSG